MFQNAIRFALGSMLGCMMLAAGGVARAATALPPPPDAYECNYWPVVISQPGSYVLTANLVMPTSCNKDAIDITANNVTLDLGGYSIIGTGAGTGIGISGSHSSSVTVKNGIVTRFPGDGILLGANATVEDVTSSSNASASNGNGVQITNGIVRRVHATGNSIGIFASATNVPSLITESDASNNTLGGISANLGTISNDTALFNGSSNSAYGIRCADASVLGNEVENNGVGITCNSAGATIANNTSNHNRDQGIGATGQIFNNTVSFNGGAGIVVQDGPSSVISNSVGNNAGYGIDMGTNTSYGNNQIYENSGEEPGGIAAGALGATSQTSGGVVISPNVCDGTVQTTTGTGVACN